MSPQQSAATMDLFYGHAKDFSVSTEPFEMTLKMRGFIRLWGRRVEREAVRRRRR